MKHTGDGLKIFMDAANTTFANQFKKNTILKFFLILFVTTLSSISYAQRPVLTDEEIVSETVIKEIDEVFQSQDFLKKKSKNFSDIKGAMTVDIGVVQNGKVSTFFKVESDIYNMDFINFMSDYILDYKFRFKLQKKQRYKIRYNIKFN